AWPARVAAGWAGGVFDGETPPGEGGWGSRGAPQVLWLVGCKRFTAGAVGRAGTVPLPARATAGRASGCAGTGPSAGCLARAVSTRAHDGPAFPRGPSSLATPTPDAVGKGLPASARTSGHPRP